MRVYITCSLANLMDGGQENKINTFFSYEYRMCFPVQ